MKAEERARELVAKYLHLKSNKLSDYSRIEYPTAKECALIACNDIIEALEHNAWQNRNWLGYYDEVKQEIEKL